MADVPWRGAVEAEGDGCILSVEVSPGAKQTVFPYGFNEWRERITMRVHGPPEGGRANKEVVAAIARFFRVPPSQVVIEVGATDRQKRVAVWGVARDDAVRLLADVLGEGV